MYTTIPLHNFQPCDASAFKALCHVYQLISFNAFSAEGLACFRVVFLIPAWSDF